MKLGKHKLRVTTNTAATNLYNDGVDIITPIHHQESSLKIGSQSLKSVTKFSPEKSVSNAGPDLSKAKAWVVFNGSTSVIKKSVNVSAILKISTGAYYVYFEKPFKTRDWVLSGSARPASGNAWLTHSNGSLELYKNTGFGVIVTLQTNASAIDCDDVMAIFHGELIDE